VEGERGGGERIGVEENGERRVVRGRERK